MGALLGLDEEPAVEVREGSGPFVVVCEHASNRLPAALGLLGLAPADLKRHIAFDPGASELAELIAAKTGGALVRQRYSRLAIDCNRAPGHPTSIPVLSEATAGKTSARPDGRALLAAVDALVPSKVPFQPEEAACRLLHPSRADRYERRRLHNPSTGGRGASELRSPFQVGGRFHKVA